MAAPRRGASATEAISQARDRSPREKGAHPRFDPGVERAKLPEGRAVHRDADRVARVAALARFSGARPQGSPPPWPRRVRRMESHSTYSAAHVLQPAARRRRRPSGFSVLSGKSRKSLSSRVESDGNAARRPARRPRRSSLPRGALARQKGTAPRGRRPRWFFRAGTFPGLPWSRSNASSTGPQRRVRRSRIRYSPPGSRRDRARAPS